MPRKHLNFAWGRDISMPTDEEFARVGEHPCGFKQAMYRYSAAGFRLT